MGWVVFCMPGRQVYPAGLSTRPQSFWHRFGHWQQCAQSTRRVNCTMQTSSGIERALRLIYYVAGPHNDRKLDFGVSEVARGLGLSKSVVHRILTALVAVDFLAVDPDTRRYRLGPGAVIVGHAALRQIDPHRIARPEMEALASKTDETVTLSLRRGRERVYIDQIVSEQEVR